MTDRVTVIVDTETISLTPGPDIVCEVAWWSLETGSRGVFVPPHDITKADPAALEINRYYERGLDLQDLWDTDGVMLDRFHAEMRGNHLVGSNPGFDVSMLNPLFAQFRLPLSPWTYVPLDVGTYAAGVLGLPIGARLSTAKLAAKIGIDPGDHSAEGDVTCTGRCLLELQRINQSRKAA
jgi:hypothetical protein